MRLNVYIAQSTGLSRRAADRAILGSRVQINGQVATVGQSISEKDTMTLDNSVIAPPVKMVTIMLHKPIGYVCSRKGQGSRTIYDLLPEELHQLKPVGRLDKDSSGLLLLTNDGQLANKLTHPRYVKDKIYEIQLDKPLSDNDKTTVERGVLLNDGVSRLKIGVDSLRSTADSKSRRNSFGRDLANTYDLAPTTYSVTLSEGRNRQIRRTFESLGYTVTKLHRTKFGDFELGVLAVGAWQYADSML